MIQIATAFGKAPKYKLDIQDVISDFNGSPHRMIRMSISGKKFPIRNAPLFVRVRNGKKAEESWLVELSPDSDQISASFPVDFTRKGDVEFGIGNDIFGIFKNPKWRNLRMLDAKLIDRSVTTINKEWLKKAMAKSR